MDDHSDTDDNGDGEGVWSPDIEQCFREALLLFPPCGRRKHILQEEGGGKMYGRNELIARHIRMRTGKIRSRKQVSSHIQVLARRKAKAESGGHSGPGVQDHIAGSSSPANNVGVAPVGVGLSLNDSVNQQRAPNTYCDVWADRPIVTTKIRLVEFSAFIEYCQLAHHQQMNQRNTEANNSIMLSPGVSPMNSSYHHNQHHHLKGTPTSGGLTRHSYVKIDYRVPVFRQSNKLERIDISQIQDKFPEIGGSEGLYQRGPPDAFFLIKFWADINNDFDYNIEDQNSYFGFSCHFETIDPLKIISCSTKACSYGLQVVEKVEPIYGAFNSTNGRYSYDIDRSPMCEFMIRFIKKLRQLPRASQMNSVLENFTVLQVITNESTSEILLCLAFVFEIASSDQNNGSLYHVYKLTKD